MKDKDLLLRLTFCLAVGGLGTVAVMCLFVGFGFSTVIGKEAVYLCLVLQAVLRLHFPQKRCAVFGRSPHGSGVWVC